MHPAVDGDLHILDGARAYERGVHPAVTGGAGDLPHPQLVDLAGCDDLHGLHPALAHRAVRESGGADAVIAEHGDDLHTLANGKAAEHVELLGD